MPQQCRLSSPGGHSSAEIVYVGRAVEGKSGGTAEDVGLGRGQREIELPSAGSESVNAYQGGSALEAR